jgi:hypothetical protein
MKYEDTNEKRPEGRLVNVYVNNAYHPTFFSIKSSNRTLIFPLVLCLWSPKSVG